MQNRNLISRLLMKDNWRHLEGNVHKRVGSKSWNFVEKQIVPRLENITDENNNKVFPKEDIHLAAGILDTNCFELKSSKRVGKNSN